MERKMISSNFSFGTMVRDLPDVSVNWHLCFPSKVLRENEPRSQYQAKPLLDEIFEDVCGIRLYLHESLQRKLFSVLLANKRMKKLVGITGKPDLG